MKWPPTRESLFRLAVVTLLCVANTALSHACVALAQDANGNPVNTLISGEQAVIIWDAPHKMEHFIRQADIATTGMKVGFLVPTPNTPTLVEVDPLIFTLTAEEAAPREVGPTVRETPIGFLLRIFGAFRVKRVFTTITSQLAVAATGEENRVQVVSETDVADYHATVLAADDTARLAQWLKANGYVWQPEDDAWLQPYLAAKWKITAFKLIQKPANQASGSIESHAIRMSFTTDHPFFPYSEPGDVELGKAAPAGARTLNVAILSNQRMSGKLADGHAWPGELQYAGGIAAPYSVSQLLAFAKLDPAKDNVTSPNVLTYYTDHSSPRPGTADLDFSAAADQSTFLKTIVNSYLPTVYVMDWTNWLANFEMLLILACPIAFFVWLRHLDRKLGRS